MTGMVLLPILALEVASVADAPRMAVQFDEGRLQYRMILESSRDLLYPDDIFTERHEGYPDGVSISFRNQEHNAVTVWGNVEWEPASIDSNFYPTLNPPIRLPRTIALVSDWFDLEDLLATAISHSNYGAWHEAKLRFRVNLGKDFRDRLTAESAWIPISEQLLDMALTSTNECPVTVSSSPN